MRIAIDAQGGDLAPKAQIEASLKAKEEFRISPVFLGDEKNIKSEIKNLGKNPEKFEIIHCTEYIKTDESPVDAIRQKKDSSIVKGLNLLKEKSVDAFISSGSSGAILAGAIMVVGRIKGISRPALATAIPTGKGGTVLIDLGTNITVKPLNLDQFAVLGSIYAKNFLKKQNPSVGLLNIGVEENKGTPTVLEAYALLKENKKINFAGNLEARDVLAGEMDVIVADGWSGNILLKTMEGVSMTLFKEIKKSLMSSTRGKIGGLLAKPAFKILAEAYNYKKYDGAALLGVDGLVLKSHGSSDAKAFRYAIKQAITVNESGVIDEIREYAKNEQEKKLENLKKSYVHDL